MPVCVFLDEALKEISNTFSNKFYKTNALKFDQMEKFGGKNTA